MHPDSEGIFTEGSEYKERRTAITEFATLYSLPHWERLGGTTGATTDVLLAEEFLQQVYDIMAYMKLHCIAKTAILRTYYFDIIQRDQVVYYNI